MSLEKRAAYRSVLFDDKNLMRMVLMLVMLMMMMDLMKIVMKMVGILLSDESGETSRLQVCVV